MGEMLDWWLSGGDWTDFKQTRRIDELEQDHAAQVAAVRSTVSRQISALDSRLERLERALLAFVELEDTRAGLHAFADAAAARRYARDLSGQLLGGDAPAIPPAPPADLPGYWLTPAVTAVVADLYPGHGDADALRATARGRDDERAELFDVLVAAIGRRDTDVRDQLDRWLPRTPALDRAGRALMIEVARGRFGDTVRDRWVQHLASLRDATADDELVADVLPDVGRRAARPGSGRGGAAGPGEVAADQAATDLFTLAALVEPAVPDATEARPELQDDPLAELLAVLINEGAPGETPVLQRMTAIRSSLAAVGVPAAPPMQSTDDAAGTVWELLAEWLRDRSEPTTHAVAVRVLGPVIDRVATTLEDQAVVDLPATREIKVAGSTVTIGPEGLLGGEWEDAARRTVAVPPGWMRPLGLAVGAVALLSAVLAAAVAPGWWALAVLAAIAAAAVLVVDRRARADAARSGAAAVEAGRRRIDEAASELRHAREAAASRREATRRAREAIVGRLTGSSTSSA